MSRLFIPRLALIVTLTCILLVAGAKVLGQETGSAIFLLIEDCRAYLSDAGSGRVEALVPGCAGSLTISRDGKYIAWITESEIYIAPLSLSVKNDRRRLTDDSRIESVPIWSPDGQEIAYWALESSGAYGRMAELLIIRVDDHSIRSLGTFMVIHFNMAWSGDLIAFASSQDRDEEIYVIDVNTRELRQLTNNDFRDDAPSWSPDGQQIVFHSTEDENDELHILDVTTGERYQLTHGMGALEPEWSPDGVHITFMSWLDNDNGIYTIDVGGAHPGALTYFPSTSVIHPVWLP